MTTPIYMHSWSWSFWTFVVMGEALSTVHEEHGVQCAQCGRMYSGSGRARTKPCENVDVRFTRNPDLSVQVSAQIRTIIQLESLPILSRCLLDHRRGGDMSSFLQVIQGTQDGLPARRLCEGSGRPPVATNFPYRTETTNGSPLLLCKPPVCNQKQLVSGQEAPVTSGVSRPRSSTQPHFSKACTVRVLVYHPRSPKTSSLRPKHTKTFSLFSNKSWPQEAGVVASPARSSGL